jgi:hypothetical protein
LFPLGEARSLDPAKDAGLLPIMWAKTPMPEKMDLGIEILNGLARFWELAVHAASFAVY